MKTKLGNWLFNAGCVLAIVLDLVAAYLHFVLHWDH